MDHYQKPFRFGIVAVVLLVALAGVTPFVAAQSTQPAWGDSLFQSAEDMTVDINEYYAGTPLNRLGKQLLGEKVNMVITDTNSGETVTFSFRVEDKNLQIRDLEQAPRDDATVKMSTDRRTIKKINAASNPGRAYQDALESGDITISGVSLVNKVKWTAINLIGGALRMFM